MSRLYFSPTRPMFELFDLGKDPFELVDLIGKPEAVAVEKELKAALQDWMIGQRDFVPLPVPPDRKKKGESLSPAYLPCRSPGVRLLGLKFAHRHAAAGGFIFRDREPDRSDADDRFFWRVFEIVLVALSD